MHGQLIPSHIPHKLVYDCDSFLAPQGHDYPQIEAARRLFAEAPPIFYTPRNGGHWVFTRFQDGLDVTRECEKFSNDPSRIADY